MSNDLIILAREDERKYVLGVVLRRIGEARLARADEGIVNVLESLATEIEELPFKDVK